MTRTSPSRNQPSRVQPSRVHPSRRAFLAGGLAAGAAGAFLAAPSPAYAGETEGISWPARRELPAFTRPSHLDALMMAGDTAEDVKLLVTTLQGLVNRERPRIYVVVGKPSEGADTWLKDTHVPYTTFTDPWQVLDRHLHRAKGIVVYDPEVVETVNVATTIGALRGGVIASPDLAGKLTAAPYDLPVLDDLRGRFDSNLAATTWAFEHLWPRTSHRVLFGVNPGQSVPIPPDNWKDFQEVVREDRPIRDSSNRAVHDLDLSAFLGGEAVYLRFTDSQPADGWGPAVHRLTVRADGTVVADLTVGTDAERAALFDKGGSTVKPQSEGTDAHRFADGTNYFVYRLPVPDGTSKLVVSVDMWNQYLVFASKTAPAVSSDDRRPASQQLRDYAVATQAMPFWLASNDSPEETTLMERIFAAVDMGTPYLGWFTDEFNGVRLASRHGVYVLAADFLENASVFGGVRAPIRPQRVPAAPKPAKKVYLTFTFSEGDNLQYDQHRMRQLWDHPDRGKVPLNWSVSPLLADVAPVMMSHYLTTATAADTLVAGPSGPGYFFPSLWPEKELPKFLAATRSYLDRPGLDVMYALDDRPALTEASAAAYNDNLDLLGVFYNMWFVRSDTTVMDGDLPVSTQLAIGDRAVMRDRILANAEDFDGSAPVFVAVGVPAWDLTPGDIVWIVDQVRAKLGDDVAAVRGDHYFTLLRQAKGLAG
ncbi:GxGYxYP domain-containing protein [Actinopolymorpha sp. NPDC004070]|uniref:GxGYxYP domain-containing protein n=1 Tax=Actinopolymorpha sp. NPDC004070 TaxID=3154548 RepID=UPI0033B1A043